MISCTASQHVTNSKPTLLTLLCASAAEEFELDILSWQSPNEMDGIDGNYQPSTVC